eukprot:m.230225 g.230225  ORF g.230225 m.230225 type:complete len:735 (-) comp33575_c0_seq1:262-2466(-)
MRSPRVLGIGVAAFIVVSMLVYQQYMRLSLQTKYDNLFRSNRMLDEAYNHQLLLEEKRVSEAHERAVADLVRFKADHTELQQENVVLKDDAKQSQLHLEESVRLLETEKYQLEQAREELKKLEAVREQESQRIDRCDPEKYDAVSESRISGRAQEGGSLRVGQLVNSFSCENRTESALSQLSKKMAKAKKKRAAPVKPPLVMEATEGSAVVVDESTSAPVIIFKSTTKKHRHSSQPIMSCSTHLKNEGQHNYRVMSYTATLRHEGIHRNESVESDVCLTIFGFSAITSVSSGEEVVCAHEHFEGSDPTFQGRESIIKVDLGDNGFLLRPGFKVEAASVSQLYSPVEYVATDMDEVVARLEAFPFALALDFEMVLVREDQAKEPALRSVRSPMRDRSVFYLPTRETSSYTVYENKGTKAVTVRGMMVFTSMLTHPIAGEHMLRVLVDGVEAHSGCLAPHQPRVASSPFGGLFHLNLTLAPGSNFSVIHTLQLVPGNAPAFDFAAYILFQEHPSVNTTMPSLQPVGEDRLGDGKLDLNSDEEFDFVEYDNEGNIFAELSQGVGVHDTQHMMMESFRTKNGKFNKPGYEWVWKRDPETKLLSAKITSSDDALCCHLHSGTMHTFTFKYCDASALAELDDTVDIVAQGDFDGDGTYDRFRMHRRQDKNDFVFYLARGNGRNYEPEIESFVLAPCNGFAGLNGAMMTVYSTALQRHILLFQLIKSYGGNRSPWFEYIVI